MVNPSSEDNENKKAETSDLNQAKIENPNTNPSSTHQAIYHAPISVATQRNSHVAPLIACAAVLFLIILLLFAFVLPQRAPTVGITTVVEDEAVTLLEQRRDALRDGLSSFQCALPNQANSGANGGALSPVPGPQAAIPPSLLMPSAGPIDHAEKATVLVLTTTDGEGVSMGTGFFINETDIVTNLHVVGNSENAVIINKAFGGAMKAKVIARSRNEAEIGAPDFAVLRLQDAKAPAILTIAASIAKGDNVIAAGFPGVVMETDTTYQRLMQGDMTAAPEMAVTQGMVTTFQQGVDGLELLLHTASTSAGNSGGPLLDYCGRVVGVNTFLRSGTAESSPLNFSQRSASLANFLKKSNISFQYESNACSPQQPNAQAAPQASPQATPQSGPQDNSGTPAQTPAPNSAPENPQNGATNATQQPSTPTTQNQQTPATQQGGSSTTPSAPNTQNSTGQSPTQQPPTPTSPAQQNAPAPNNNATQNNATPENYNPFTQRRSSDDSDMNDQVDDE